MFKNKKWSIVTLCILLLMNWGAAAFFNAEFIDVSVFTGVVVTLVIGFFNSSGGFGSNHVRMMTQARTGIKIEQEKKDFKPTVAFYTSIAYTVIALIVTLFYYKDYFVS